ncbi:hypothetical protein D3Z51_05795 [Clostridiaceae bacterium]|nr:hypothetical protein [Clostridiaceae bacterium]RKI16057.1 hypothetical protein D7V81_05310 [bacterium 1XD21-70]
MKNYLMKKVVIGLSIMLMVIPTITAYAQNKNVSTDAITRMYEGEDFVRAEVSPRGQLISSVQLELSEEGYHRLGIYSEVLCHVDMKKIKMTVTLQKYVNGSWTNVHRKEEEWLAEDYPELSMAMISYDLTGMSAGKYRLKGGYSVFELNGSLQEFKTVTTASLTIN